VPKPKKSVAPIPKAQGPIHPEKALVQFREYLEKMEGVEILGKDGLPIHWMVKDESYGLLVLDSGYLMTQFGFSGIQMRLGGSQTEWTPEEIAPHFQRFLDWLGLNLPQSKTWAVEYKKGCPLIPVDRPILEG